MDYDIPQEILSKCKECEKSCSCLKEETREMCKLKECIDGKLLFVDAPEFTDCPCRHTFGSLSYCTCPVRLEINRKYGE